MSIERPRIALLATGGTIVSSGKSPDQMTGYGIENFRVTDLVAAVPGIEKIAALEVEQVANIDSSSMTYGVWRALAERIEAYAAREDIDGIVVTHGTDTLEETAYFLTLVLNTAKPVVLTGAMRPATALSADGPLNLYNAVRVASTPAAQKKGVLIVLNDLILDAREGTKTNPTNVATFFSRDFGAIGMIAGSRIEFFRCPSRAHTIRTPFSATTACSCAPPWRRVPAGSFMPEPETAPCTGILKKRSWKPRNRASSSCALRASAAA